MSDVIIDFYLENLLAVPGVSDVLLVGNNFLGPHTDIFLKHDDGILPYLPQVCDYNLNTKYNNYRFVAKYFLAVTSVFCIPSGPSVGIR